MWVVFRKSDGKVIATTAQAPGKKDAALAEVVRGQVGSPPIQNFDAVEVPDTGIAPGQRLGSQRQDLAVQSAAGGKMEVVDAAPAAGFLQITTNAGAFHPVDRVPLIPGNGTSFLVVTLQNVASGGPELGAGDRGIQDVVIEEIGIPATGTDVIWLRTSHGTLREDRDPDPPAIRSVTLIGGIARFRLYSEPAKRLATVQLLAENPQIQAGGLQVEFT